MTDRLVWTVMAAGLAAVAFLAFFVHTIVHATLNVLSILGGNQ